MYTDITGIILAGGKSTRMGENKSFLKIDGITVIERVIKLMSSIFNDVILITNTPKEYEFVDITMYKDIFEYKGPLAGIHSGLSNTTTEENFIISCDMPLINPEMINHVVNYKSNKLIRIGRANNHAQTLFGMYSKNILSYLEKILDQNNRKSIKQNIFSVFRLLDKVDHEIIDLEACEGYTEHLFYNMNRPEDYEKIKGITNND